MHSNSKASGADFEINFANFRSQHQDLNQCSIYALAACQMLNSLLCDGVILLSDPFELLLQKTQTAFNQSFNQDYAREMHNKYTNLAIQIIDTMNTEGRANSAILVGDESTRNTHTKN